MRIQLMANEKGFEVLKEQQQVGKIVWTLENNRMIMNGTLVDPSLRGQNVGEQLLDHAADFARAHDYKMEAVCPYVVKMFERFSRYDDVKL